jgi:NADPH2:quinone reductase
MRAALCRKLGEPEVVAVEDVAAPHLGPGRIRVAVHAAAVNFPDVLIVAGRYQIPVEPPFIPGSEFAGTVIEVADDVTTVAVGDRVFGSVLAGAFAEEVAVSVAAVTKVPDGVDLDVAAGFGVAHRTAYHVLRSVAGADEGDEVVVLGAGGGVGLAAVQLATVMGCSVTAIASSAGKLDAARLNGASRTVDHKQVRDLRKALREQLSDGADVVVDPVGGDLAEPALRSLRPGGRFVTVGYASGTIPRIPLNLVLVKGIEIRGFEFLDFATRRAEEAARDEAELMALLASGRVVPHIGARFALDGAASALRVVADGQAIGKVLVEFF